MEVTNKDELSRYIYPDTKTMEIMNTFEGYGSEGGAYKRLIVKNLHKVFAGKYIISYCLIVTRLENSQKTEGDITFSQFKKDGSEVYRYCDQMIRERVEKGDAINKKDYYHKTPYLLRAQNKMNRTGYGWEWDWSYRYGNYTEGTYYGETTSYIFAGVRICYIQQRKPIENAKAPNEKSIIPSNLRIEKIWFRGTAWLKVSDNNETAMVKCTKKVTRDRVAALFVEYKKNKVLV